MIRHWTCFQVQNLSGFYVVVVFYPPRLLRAIWYLSPVSDSLSSNLRPHARLLACAPAASIFSFFLLLSWNSILHKSSRMGDLREMHVSLHNFGQSNFFQYCNFFFATWSAGTIFFYCSRERANDIDPPTISNLRLRCPALSDSASSRKEKNKQINHLSQQ